MGGVRRELKEAMMDPERPAGCSDVNNIDQPTLNKKKTLRIPQDPNLTLVLLPALQPILGASVPTLITGYRRWTARLAVRIRVIFPSPAFPDPDTLPVLQRLHSWAGMEVVVRVLGCAVGLHDFRLSVLIAGEEFVVFEIPWRSLSGPAAASVVYVVGSVGVGFVNWCCVM